VRVELQLTPVPGHYGDYSSAAVQRTSGQHHGALLYLSAYLDERSQQFICVHLYHRSRCHSRVEGPDSLLNTFSTEGAQLALGRALGAQAVMPARDERAVHRLLHAHLRSKRRAGQTAEGWEKRRKGKLKDHTILERWKISTDQCPVLAIGSLDERLTRLAHWFGCRGSGTTSGVTRIAHGRSHSWSALGSAERRRKQQKARDVSQRRGVRAVCWCKVNGATIWSPSEQLLRCCRTLPATQHPTTAAATRAFRRARPPPPRSWSYSATLGLRDTLHRPAWHHRYDCTRAELGVGNDDDIGKSRRLRIISPTIQNPGNFKCKRSFVLYTKPRYFAPRYTAHVSAYIGTWSTDSLGHRREISQGRGVGCFYQARGAKVGVVLYSTQRRR